MLDVQRVKVQFEGDEIDCALDDRGAWVSIRKVCEVLGLESSSQFQKLKAKPWAVMSMVTDVAADKKSRQMTMIHLDSLPMWLATIESSRVSTEVRDKLDKYQLRCARALRDYFYGPQAGRDTLDRGVYQEAVGVLDLARKEGLLDDRGLVLRKAALLRKVGLDLLSDPGVAFASAPSSSDVITVHAKGPVRVLEAQSLDGTYSATSVGKPYGLAAKEVNQLAKEEGIYDNPEFGLWDTVNHGDGSEINKYWRYNEAGKTALEPAMRAQAKKPPAPPTLPATASSS